jgi:hypothetical protein
MTPTEKAKWFLDGAVTNLREARLKSSISLVALGLEQMAQGQQEMATGLRAIYLKLEELERANKRAQAGLPLIG